MDAKRLKELAGITHKHFIVERVTEIPPTATLSDLYGMFNAAVRSMEYVTKLQPEERVKHLKVIANNITKIRDAILHMVESGHTM